MSQNKKQIELPPIPERPDAIPRPDGREWDLVLARDRTLGRLAVMLDADASVYEAYARDSQEAYAVANSLEASKRNPMHQPTGKLRTRIGQRRGKVMTDEETRFVEDVTTKVSSSHEYYAGRAQEARKKISKEIHGVRGRLAKLDEENVLTLENYANSLVSGELADKKNDTENGSMTWAEWLSEHAEDEDVLAFLRAHNEHVQTVQEDPEVGQIIEKKREFYKTRVAQLVAEGKLHADALQSLDKVDGIEVRIGDVFDTIMDGSHGYHIRGQKFVVVTGVDIEGAIGEKPSNTVAKNVDKTYVHEMNHAVLGSLGERWLDEALTELIAADIRGGDPLSYPSEIGLLSELLGDDDKHGVAYMLAKQAYTEKTGDDMYKRFTSILGEVWRDHTPEGFTGEDVIEAVNACVAAYEQDLMNKGRELSDARSWAVLYAKINLFYKPETVFNDYWVKKELPKVESS